LRLLRQNVKNFSPADGWNYRLQLENLVGVTFLPKHEHDYLVIKTLLMLIHVVHLLPSSLSSIFMHVSLETLHGSVCSIFGYRLSCHHICLFLRIWSDKNKNLGNQAGQCIIIILLSKYIDGKGKYIFVFQFEKNKTEIKMTLNIILIILLLYFGWWRKNGTVSGWYWLADHNIIEISDIIVMNNKYYWIKSLISAPLHRWTPKTCNNSFSQQFKTEQCPSYIHIMHIKGDARHMVSRQ